MLFPNRTTPINAIFCLIGNVDLHHFSVQHKWIWYQIFNIQSSTCTWTPKNWRTCQNLCESQRIKYYAFNAIIELGWEIHNLFVWSLIDAATTLFHPHVVNMSFYQLNSFDWIPQSASGPYFVRSGDFKFSIMDIFEVGNRFDFIFISSNISMPIKCISCY